MEDKRIALGGAIKALGGNRKGGYLVRFTSPLEKDFYGEYFDEATDFQLDDHPLIGKPILFNHGYDPLIGTKTLAYIDVAEIRSEPDADGNRGLWIEWEELQMAEKREYIEAVNRLHERSVREYGHGNGLSSGALPPSVDVARNGHITRWAIIEGSITNIPADPGNQIVIRSADLQQFINSQEQEPEAQPEGDEPVSAGNVSADNHTPIITEVRDMADKNEQPVDEPTPVDPMQERMDNFERLFSEKMNVITEYLENEPRVHRSGFYTQDGGTADKSVKNVVDLLMAIRRRDATRLTKHYGLKAQSENDGTTGGYYVPQQVLTDMLPGLSLTSGVGQLVTRIPVMAPAGEMPIRDYSRTPTASAGNTATAQGVESQARSEGGAYTLETMYFEMLQFRVTDFASGYMKVPRELSEDLPTIEALLRAAIQEDVANREEYGILRGNGVNQPLGVLNWGGTIDLAEDTDNTFAIADADEMVSRLLATNGARVAWVHHPAVFTHIAGFERGTGGAVLHDNIPGMLPTSLYGYGRLNSQHLPNVGTDGYIVLGDWSKYFLFERGGLYIDFSADADFLNGNNVWRFGKRIDGKPAMTAAVTLADGSFTLSPFVAIQNKT